MWYTLNAREQIERVVEVRLDYKGLPTGLIVTGGQLNKVSVRLRGPQELLRSMTNREISYDGSVRRDAGQERDPADDDGENKPPELRAYEVLEVTPSRMILEVDKIMETNLPVKVALRASPAASSVRLKDLVVDPPQVTVRGPASVIASMKEIQAEIPVDLAAEGKAVSEEVPLLAPPAVELNPQVVKVTWKIDVKRRTLSLQRDIIFEGENPNVSAQPSRANLMVSVPQAMVKDAGYLAQFQVSIPSDTAMPAEDGAVNAPLQVAVPQGGRVSEISPETVSISLASERISGLFRCSITKRDLGVVDERSSFGTDGMRGRVNKYPMTPEVALRLGACRWHVLSGQNRRSRVVIGKDTRLSGYVFENALAAGLLAAGMDVFLVGPCPLLRFPFSRPTCGRMWGWSSPRRITHSATTGSSFSTPKGSKSRMPMKIA